ncbi:uncharacterized protein LOC128276745, partial [Anopheles cruzii]|uniref:uncharacterized protein LOC128276745 n=1 Tax=Anopheles cruzii TaxID=68878 RepID=UPI0022EC37BA
MEDQSASSTVDEETPTTSGPANQGNGDQSSELIIHESDELLSLIISDSEGDEQEVPTDSTNSKRKGAENADADMTGIALLDVTSEAVSENNVGDAKQDDKQAKERSSEEGDVGAAEKLEQAENDNIDLTELSSPEGSFTCNRGVNKGPVNQLSPVRNDGKKNVARATNVNTTAEELFNSLLGERSSAAITETTVHAERSDMIKFSDEVDKDSSKIPAENKQKAVDRTVEIRPSVEQTEIAQQTEMATEAGEAAGTKRLPEKIDNVSGVTETADANGGEVKIPDEDADGIASQKKDASTVPTALHEKRLLRETEEDVTDDLAKRAIDANKKDGLAAVDEAQATQSDEHQVPIVSTSDDIDEPPRKKQKPSEVISTGDDLAIVLSESVQETSNDREHTSGVAFVANSCESISMNGQIKRRGSLLSEIEADKTVEANRSSSALSSAEMLPKKPTALEVLVIDDDDEEDISNPRATEAVNDTKKLEDSGKRDVHTSGVGNTDNISSAKRAKMAECGTLSDEEKSLRGVNPDTKNEDDKTKKRTEPTVLRMDFLRRFARPLTTMTQSDLEVLIMQKITEAIVNREEMAEMRQLLAKQDAMLTAYRQRITDLSKRLSDITLIQTRVLSELDKRSSRQVLPLKITRNVGLQIYLPRISYNEVEDHPLHSVAGSTSPIMGPKECLPNSAKNVSSTTANCGSQTPQTNAAKPLTAAHQTVPNLNKHSGTNTVRPPQTVTVARNSMVSSNGALLSNGATNKQTALAPASCDRRSTNTPNPKTTESSTSSSNSSVMNGNNVARNASDSNHGGNRKSCHKFTPMRAPMSAQQQAQHQRHAREQQEYMVQQQIKSQQAQRQLQTLNTG